MNNTNYVVGIVGATGAVGQELVRLLHERNFPLAQLRLFASARSVGKTITVGDRTLTVRRLKRAFSTAWTWHFLPWVEASRERWHPMPWQRGVS